MAPAVVTKARGTKDVVVAVVPERPPVVVLMMVRDEAGAAAAVVAPRRPPPPPLHRRKIWILSFPLFSYPIPNCQLQRHRWQLPACESDSRHGGATPRAHQTVL